MLVQFSALPRLPSLGSLFLACTGTMKPCRSIRCPILKLASFRFFGGCSSASVISSENKARPFCHVGTAGNTRRCCFHTDASPKIESVVTGQAPITLEWNHNPGKNNRSQEPRSNKRAQHELRSIRRNRKTHRQANVGRAAVSRQADARRGRARSSCLSPPRSQVRWVLQSHRKCGREQALVRKTRTLRDISNSLALSHQLGERAPDCS